MLGLVHTESTLPVFFYRSLPVFNGVIFRGMGKSGEKDSGYFTCFFVGKGKKKLKILIKKVPKESIKITARQPKKAFYGEKWPKSIILRQKGRKNAIFEPKISQISEKYTIRIFERRLFALRW